MFEDGSSSLLRSHLTTLETAPLLQLRSMHRKSRVMSAAFEENDEYHSHSVDQGAVPFSF